MAEVLVQFTELIVADGVAYRANACGAPTSDGLWQGWIEFTPTSGGPSFRSRRETTQPNKVDAVYWATGLTPVFLLGARERAFSAPFRGIGCRVSGAGAPEGLGYAPAHVRPDHDHAP